MAGPAGLAAAGGGVAGGAGEVTATCRSGGDAGVEAGAASSEAPDAETHLPDSLLQKPLMHLHWPFVGGKLEDPTHCVSPRHVLHLNPGKFMQEDCKQQAGPVHGSGGPACIWLFTLSETLSTTTLATSPAMSVAMPVGSCPSTGMPREAAMSNKQIIASSRDGCRGCGVGWRG